MSFFYQYLCCFQDIQRRGCFFLDQDLAGAQGRAGNHEGPRWMGWVLFTRVGILMGNVKKVMVNSG